MSGKVNMLIREFNCSHYIISAGLRQALPMTDNNNKSFTLSDKLQMEFMMALSSFADRPLQ